MLRWLKAIVDWIFGRHVWLTQLSLQAPNAGGVSSNRHYGPDPPTRPRDPESPVRVPRRYGPTGRSASVAVAEPGDDENLMAIGSRIGDRPGVRRRSSDEGYRRWTWRSPPPAVDQRPFPFTLLADEDPASEVVTRFQ